MRLAPKVLLALSLPAGLIGYAVGVQLMTLLLPAQANGVLMLFVPLFVAGLCMMPFLIPFLDQKAKADLAAHRAQQAVTPDAEPKRENGGSDAPRTGG